MSGTTVDKPVDKRVTLEDAARFGIDDYAQEFSDPKGTADPEGVFSNIINQDKPVRKFAEALGLRNRAILNLGDAGIGKSTITKDLVDALRALDRGETITGEYAPDIVAFHKRLQANRHGDIIGMWNPKDYTAPLIIRARVNSEGGKRVGEDLETQIIDYMAKLTCDAEIVIRELYAREHALTEIHKRLLGLKQKSLAGSGKESAIDLDSLEWTVTPVRSKRRTSGFRVEPDGAPKSAAGIYEHFNKELALAFEQTTSLYSHSDAVQAFEYVLGKGPQYIRERRKGIKALRKESEKALEKVIDDANELLRTYATAWETREPAIKQWFLDAAEFLGKEDKKKSIYERLTTIEHNKREKKKDAKKDDDEEKDFSIEPYTIDIEVMGKSFPMPELLTPQVLYTDDASGKTVIRELSVFEPMELFASMESYGRDMDEPLHQQIELGPLAYADLVVIDDGLGDTVLNPDFRRALLTFLQDGSTSIFMDKVQVKMASDCFMIANETDFPFFREKFKNESPEYDEGMHRRFTVVEWPRVVEANAQSRAAFPRILSHAADAIRKEWSGAGDVTFSPQAANLLYQHLTTANDGLLFPMNIGEQQDKLYIPLLQQARRRGGSVVTGDDVVRFVSEKRDVLLEKLYTHFTLLQHGRETNEPKVGQTYGLWVTSDHEGIEYGGIGRVNIMVAPRIGKLTSTDMDAEMTDETYKKGMGMSNAWLQATFGPFDIDIRTSFVGYEGIGGPSAGAAHTYAIMSALGKIPVDQNTFMTGTILDQDGTVGVIGGVYGKVRGAHMFTKMLRATNKETPAPITVLIPKMNAKEFVRNLLFDKELQRTMDDGQLTVRYHDDIWDGFEAMSGMTRAEYEPRIRTAINDLETRAATHDYRIHHAMQEPPKRKKP